jgi:hypothetical protein
MAEITLGKLKKLTSKKNLLKYLRSLPPDKTFNMRSGCQCAYHGLLCAALSLDDDQVGAYVDTLCIDNQDFAIGYDSFAARFQQQAMDEQVDQQYYEAGGTTVAQLIEIAKGIEE